MAYSTEQDVYNATGQKTEVVQKLSGKNITQVTELITDMIQKADRMIKNELGVPVTIRKEYHMFNYEEFIELGPHDDKLGFYGAYNPQNCVEGVFAIYDIAGRIKLPFPKDCDRFTEDITDMQEGSNCTLSKEVAIFKCGTASIKAVFSAAGSFYFSKNQNMEKNIEPWDYIGFWFRTSDKTAVFTLKIFDIDGNFISKTFSCRHNNTWEVIKLHTKDFTNYAQYKFDSTRMMQYIQIEASKACTIYFDNFNFNDGLFWTYPEGLVVWSIPITTSQSSGNFEFYVTYSFDQYKIDTPEEINLASAKKAGILLLEFLIGCRQRITGFVQASDDLENMPDRETLEFRRAELQRQVEGILAGVGFKTYQGMSED
jgi:hypothetical protein